MKEKTMSIIPTAQPPTGDAHGGKEAGQPPQQPEPLIIRYLNHDNKVAERRILPIETWHGTTEWHPATPQWFLDAYDLDRGGARRSFAFSGFLGMPEQPAPNTLGPEAPARADTGEQAEAATGGAEQ